MKKVILTSILLVGSSLATAQQPPDVNQAPVAISAPAPAPPSARVVGPNDDVYRTTSDLKARQDLLEQQMDTEDAQFKQQKSRITQQKELIALRQELSVAQKESAPKKDSDNKEPVNILGVPTLIVKNIYGFDNQFTAEIYVNGSKILAVPGTILVTGDEVVDVKLSGVTLKKKESGQKEVLLVVGSGGVTPSFLQGSSVKN